MVVSPLSETVPVPVLKVPVPVWEKLPEASARPVAPEIAPPELMSSVLESSWNVPVALPI